jgi:hypothetical protein
MQHMERGARNFTEGRNGVVKKEQPQEEMTAFENSETRVLWKHST